MLVAAPGQTSFLVGGLVIAGLALRRRERIAGALFGLAAAFKPQLLVLLPLALVADGRWRTIFYSGLIGLSVCLTSAVILGPGSWIEWLKAVPRFQHIFFTTLSVTRAVTPYAWLVSKGASGAWAYLLVPPVAVGVWMTFRKTGRLAERMLALFGGTLLIIPYAMNYELALLVPAAAVFLSRIEDNRWPASLAAAFLFGVGHTLGAPALVAGIALLAWAAVGAKRKSVAVEPLVARNAPPT